GFYPDWLMARPKKNGPEHPVTLDDHSKVVPRLPIPNRTVKRLCADDSGRTSVKVGHRQALIVKTPQRIPARGFLFGGVRPQTGSDPITRGRGVSLPMGSDPLS